MATLADIEHEISNILSVAEELPEEQQPVALDYLESLALQETEKVDAISFAVRKRKGQIEWLKQEEQRLRRLRQSMERRVDDFRNYLVALMQRYRVKTLKGNAGSLSLRKSSSVEVLNLSALPEAYKEVVVEEKPRKKELREALAAGEVIDGAMLIQNTTLTVR